MSKKAVRILVSVVVLGGAFVALMATTMKQDTEYYMHVDEVMPQASAWYGKHLQLHGYVVDGSIARRPNTLDYRFQVKYGESQVQASYTGVLPDTFKDGAEVVLKGHLDRAGFEVAPDGVIAKCPSRYQPTNAPGR